MSTSKEKPPKTAATGPTSTQPPSPVEEQQAAVDRARAEALLLEEKWTPVGLRSVLGFSPDDMSILGVRMFLLKITSGVKDPVEKMLVQQFTVAHHRLFQLHTQAAETQNLEAVKVYNAAAARLQGEIRRLALAIRQYRAPVATRTFTVVEQQNVATKQEVTYVAQGADQKKLHSHDIEQGSNADGPDRTQEPQSRASWLREQETMAGAHTGWA